MRVLSGLFCLVLILFALVQYNDPDFLFWFVIYAMAAAWCGLAAINPYLLTQSGPLRAFFALCLIGAIVGTFYFWPSGFAWWRGGVIWDNELVREGLGMATVTVGLVITGLTWWLSGRTASRLSLNT